ncbi:hypothetical protein PVAP13_1KG208054 [Panicum virgatum]|uniref:Uncharacterized protein n=1 Tax=Panicum virgatum TaxID=38727 RepID=A0A8T0XB94_PANVG|nr:hypothetical protein PVAP13_1KG208054 [Panicum virgatum]
MKGPAVSELWRGRGGRGGRWPRREEEARRPRRGGAAEEEDEAGSRGQKRLMWPCGSMRTFRKPE